MTISHEQEQLYATARHYVSIDRPERALQILDQVDGSGVEQSEFWRLRGLALYKLERYAEADHMAQQGLALEPDSISLLCLRSECAADLGDLATAERAILQALNLAPETPLLLCSYALLVGRAGQFSKAEHLLAEAARIDADDGSIPPARVALAYLQGNARQTVAASRSLLERDPENVFGHYMLGISLAQRGEVASAGRSLNNAAQLNPSQKEIVAIARDLRINNHWLLRPLRPFHRIGSIGVWLGAVIIIFTLLFLKLFFLMRLFVILYFIFVVYSWIMPPLVRFWLQRR